MQQNKTVYILCLVMIVNALSYGILIPLLYPFASRFGINPIGLSLLFASFSFFQFLATPVIGRLSDVYGRKPLLLISLLGTSISLALFASASSVFMLFFSRILDGITGGNNSVAQAVIADSVSGKDRTRAFGFLGAAFGFGFLLGPGIGGILSRISLTAPFWFASMLALTSVCFGWFFLEETLPKNNVPNKSRSFSLTTASKALRSPAVGILLLLTLLSATAHNAMVIGFQSYSFDILGLDPFAIGVLFSCVGVVSITMQAGAIPFLQKAISSRKKLLTYAFIGSGVMTLFLFSQPNVITFFVGCMLYSASFAPQMALLPAMISSLTSSKDQGGVLGINQSIMSAGQIIGPIIAGLCALISIPTIFLAASLVFFVSLFAVRKASDSVLVFRF